MSGSTDLGTPKVGIQSVGLALPADVFTVSNSPVTSVGDLTAALNSQTKNTVLSAPANADGVPTFRALTPDDLAPGGITGKTTIVDGPNTHRLSKNGNIVAFYFAGLEIAAYNIPGGYIYPPGTIPAGYRPVNTFPRSVTSYIDNGGVGHAVLLEVDPDGSIWMFDLSNNNPVADTYYNIQQISMSWSTD